MTQMRPFQIIVISIFGVLALGGLLLFATFKGFRGEKPVGPVTIWGTLPDSAVSPVLTELVRNNASFKGAVYEEHDPGAFDRELADALAAGTGPDLIITNQEHLVSQENKLALIPYSEISERKFRDTYLPISSIFLSSAGSYAIPLALDPLVLYYNRARLESANIPQPPRTWEAVLGVTPSLTDKTSVNVVEKSAIPLGTYENIGDARAIVSLLLLQAGNPIVEVSDAGRRATIGRGAKNSTGGSGTESAMDFYTQFADPAKIVYTWNRSIPDARQSFIAGDAAMYLGFASERSLIEAANPNLDFDIGPVPQPETASNRVNYGIVYAFAIPKGSHNSSGALRLARALAAEEPAAHIASNAGLAPAIRALLSARVDDPYAPIVYSQALIAKGWLSPSPAAVDRIFAAMINAILSGRDSVHDALTTAEESLNAALP